STDSRPEVRQPQIAIASKSTVRAGLLSDHEQTGSYLIPIASGLAILKLMAISAFMGSQLIACRLPKADCALFTVVALSPPVRFRLFVSGGSASARESLRRGLGSRWFTERVHRSALVTYFQEGRVLRSARRLDIYCVVRC